MIAVSDLRMGNAFIARGRTQYVDFINRHTINIYNEDQCKPIELTPEILVNNCGFENTGRKIEIEVVYKKDKRFQWHSSTKEISVEIEQLDSIVTLWTGINQLHKLQNLIYALTGEELEIKGLK